MTKITSKVFLEGETVYLTKSDSLWGWRVVHPIRNEDGKINWMNLLFGGKGNLITLLILLFIISTAIYGVGEMTESCRDMADNPCKYSKMDCSGIYNPVYEKFEMPLNLPRE